MIASTAEYKVTWEKLPEDFVLPDDPVDNINQPALAAALTDSLVIARKLPENALTSTNYGICATVNGKIVIKAPDWAYANAIYVPREDVKRSYTPQLQGEVPVIVMEFLSDTEGTEYSIKPTYPPGKWFFYERILKVPNYAIFEPDAGTLEVYGISGSGQYEIKTPDENHRYWIDEMKLFLGVWQGSRENRTGFWLRWWNEAQELLLWSSEAALQERIRAEQERIRAEQERIRAEQERMRAEQERIRAEQERMRAERLAAQLKAAGIEPEV